MPDRVAVVTGASSGIGEATAVALADAGFGVLLAARRSDRIEALASRIGGDALAVTCDVSDDAAAHSLIDRAKSELGRVDVLVNNAGVMLLGPITGADTEEWRRVVGANLLGLRYCTHAALPVMQEQGGGHIVNVSSVAGRTARLGFGVYNATKWGVVAFSEALRQEALHSNVRVTVVEPGFVETELQGHNTNPIVVEATEKMREEIGQVLTAEDIADAIVYAVAQPEHVSLNELLIRPTRQ